MTDLVAEFLAAQERLSGPLRSTLLKAGIPSDQLDVWGWHGVATKRGRSAFVSAVRGMAGGNIEYPQPAEMVHFGDIIDLIIWHPRTPNRWELRTGAATVLGVIEPQFLSPAPVPIWRTPLGWFRAGGTGICILTNAIAEQRHLLLQVHHLVAEDIEHGREIRDLLTRPIWTPTISVPTANQRRAA
jgi:hypothetical protein